jgi:deoxycytidylate deaminase
MATSDYVETDFQSFSTSLPTIVNIPPIVGIRSIGYNGEYWMAVGQDSLQIRRIFSYSDVFTKVEYARVLNATTKSILSYRQTLINTNSTLYSNAIQTLNSQYVSKANSYKSMLSAAAAKFKNLQSLGYNTQPQTIKTLHNMMRSKDGFTWEIVEDNPFQYYTRSLLSSGSGISVSGFSAPSNGVQTITITVLTNDQIRFPAKGAKITITGASNQANNVTNATVISRQTGSTSFTISNASGQSEGSGATLSYSYDNDPALYSNLTTINDINFDYSSQFTYFIANYINSGYPNGTGQASYIYIKKSSIFES